ncbi:hypothetical protein Q1695_008036 [Nippostrongylus brasiliensis]|nr:hypothetical protein Q1695_008036 [Nippostrongylus brasiliensis]
MKWLILAATIAIAIASQCTRDKYKEDGSGPWECGTTGFIKWHFQSMQQVFCPSYRNPINLCCYKHDDCYGNQEGRTKCDKEFRSCMMDATKDSSICKTFFGRYIAYMVEQFGQSAYDASAPQPKDEKN